MLSPRQSVILTYIEASVRDRGYPPTVRELGTAAGLMSTAAVRYQLLRLEALGYISREPDVARGIALRERAA